MEMLFIAMAYGQIRSVYKNVRPPAALKTPVGFAASLQHMGFDRKEFHIEGVNTNRITFDLGLATLFAMMFVFFVQEAVEWRKFPNPKDETWELLPAPCSFLY